MRKRWGLILTMVLMLMALPAAAQAGRWGNVHLSRPVDVVAVGKVPVFFQVLQHDHYPIEAEVVTVTITAPDGSVTEAPALLDPAFGADNVYRLDLLFSRPGTWKLTFVVKEPGMHFPPLTKTVDVKPVGSTMAPMGPIQIRERGTDSTTMPIVSREAPEPDYGTAPSALSVALAGGGAAAVAAAAVIWFLQRRRSAAR